MLTELLKKLRRKNEMWNLNMLINEQEIQSTFVLVITKTANHENENSDRNKKFLRKYQKKNGKLALYIKFYQIILRNHYQKILCKDYANLTNNK